MVQMMPRSCAIDESLNHDLPMFANPPIGDTITLDIQVADVKELHRSVKDNTAVRMHLHTSFYGANEFCVRDCSGCVLTFAGHS
jgi:uncharacterized glyoxalase superfamily protein PhnB